MNGEHDRVTTSNVLRRLHTLLDLVAVIPQIPCNFPKFHNKRGSPSFAGVASTEPEETNKIVSSCWFIVESTKKKVTLAARQGALMAKDAGQTLVRAITTATKRVQTMRVPLQERAQTTMISVFVLLQVSQTVAVPKNGCDDDGFESGRRVIGGNPPAGETQTQCRLGGSRRAGLHAAARSCHAN